ncbi:MAG: VTT domain-containing protein [Bacteroidota bacterium]|nr:VTT domain-containing protein [Bacteroidota bacterium]
MESAWQFFKDLLNPESIVQLGLPLLLFVIFAETGLFIGFFLPGDSLVFISGLICATNNDYLGVGIFTLIFCMSIAAIIGNIAGYWFGRKVGEKLFKRGDSFFFKRRHLIATKNFYERHGGKAIILGRFLPIIRTFAPILAGVINIDFKKFMIYNVVGAFAWISSISSIGYFLGQRFPGIKDHLGWIVIGLIVITTIPVILTYIKEKKKGHS